MANTYDVVAHRDGAWWTFEIPALTAQAPAGGRGCIVAMGQTRTTAEIASEARDIAAMWTNVDAESISVCVTYRDHAQDRGSREHLK